MLEQLAHLLLLAGGFAGLGALGFGRAAARLLWNAVPEFLAGCGQSVQHRLGNFLEDVELTDLMGRVGPQLMQRLGVQLRAVGGDAPDCQAALVQSGFEVSQEAADVVLGRVVLQDAEGQAVEGSVVNQRKHAERAVVQLIGGEVAAEVGECALEVVGVNGGPAFFPLRPRPNSEWWPKEQKRGGRATDANWPCDRVGRPQPPVARRSFAPGGCIGSWAGPGRTGPRG